MTTDPGLPPTAVSDEQLMALLTGELEVDRAEWLRDLLDRDPQLQTRLQAIEAQLQTWLERLRTAGPAPQTRGTDLASGPLPEDIVPHHHLTSEIGRGGQGVVYRALQIETQRIVAVKLLHEGPLATAAVQRRFEREVELAAALDHPGIVTLYDAGIASDGRRYLVMEWIDGQRLDRFRIEQEADFRDRIDWLRRLCAPIHHAHQRGVIHLDLKSSNVLVRQDGALKVLDFGLARWIEDDDRLATVTGLLAGTPIYMAPEQIRGGSRACDVRTDIYALGVMLYETVTGSFPYPLGDTPLQTLENIERLDPRPPSAAWNDPAMANPPGPPNKAQAQDLDAIVSKALAKNPERRYQTVTELEADLQALTRGEVVLARQGERGYRFRRGLRKHRKLALAVMALLALTAFFAWMAIEQSKLRTLADQRFEQARGIAMAFVRELDHRIKTLPGSAPVRRFIVERGLQYLEFLKTSSTDDPELDFEIAVGYHRIGRIQADNYTDSMGDLPGAEASLLQALEVLDRIANPTEAEPHLQNDLRFLVEIRLAKVEHALGHAADSNARLRAVGRRVERLLETYPTRFEYRRTHGLYLDSIGSALLFEGKKEASLESYHASQRVFEELLADFPQNQALQRDIAVGLAKIANIHSGQGRTEDALEGYRRFLEYAEAAAAQAGPDLVPRADIAVGREWVGRLLADLGRPTEALPYLEQAEALYRELARDFPRNLEFRFGHCSVINRNGEAQLALKDLEAAKNWFQQLSDSVQALCSEFPEQNRAHRMLGVSQYKWFEWHRARSESMEIGSATQTVELQSARAALVKCSDMFEQLERDGRLAPSDAGVPAVLRAELEAFDQELLEH